MIEVSVVLVQLVVAGSVSDFDTAKLLPIRERFANLALVNTSDVRIEVTAASVKMGIEIVMSNSTSTSSFVNRLETTVLASPDSASSWLGVQVEQILTITSATTTMGGGLTNGTTSAGGTNSTQKQSGGGNGGGIAAGVVFGILSIGAIAAYLVWRMRKAKESVQLLKMDEPGSLTLPDKSEATEVSHI